MLIQRQDQMPAGPERRFLILPGGLQVRADRDDPLIGGYAAVFDQWTDIMGLFKERVRPGAFKKTIQEADVRALLNHDASFVLGRNKADTLELQEDQKGLRYEIKPPGTQWAKDLAVSIERGDINQSSFAFEVVKETWDHDNEERSLLELKLYDVSVVTYPAYEDTVAQVRSLFPGFGNTLQPLTGLLLKASRGVRLNEDDRAAIEEHYEWLRSFFAKHDPEPAASTDHSAADDEPVIDHSHQWAQEQARMLEKILQFHT